MLPDLPWYGWIFIAVIVILAVLVKVPVYRKIFKNRKIIGEMQDKQDFE